MQLKPLFEGQVIFDEMPETAVAPYGDRRAFGYVPAHGWIKGRRLSGEVRCHNLFENLRSRKPKLYRPHLRGAIDTDDGALILFDAAGFNRFSKENLGTIVMHMTFQSGDKRYGWLNDTLSVVESFATDVLVDGEEKERFTLRAFSCTHDLAPDWNPSLDDRPASTPQA